MADFNRPEPRECRSLILDEHDDWRIVCCPYFKFFDYTDKHFDAMSFDWLSGKIYEKVDGSAAQLYFYQGEW